VAADETAAGPAETEGTAQGRRVLDLLWRGGTGTGTTAARGPRPKTNLAEVVGTAVALTDAEGLDALSMRKVAERLGVGAMSLYTYVPGRSELVELMVDRVYGGQEPPPAGLGWADRLRHWAGQTLRLYAAHPWLLETNPSRQPIGPHVLDASESLHATLLDGGFVGAQNVAVANLVRWQLIGIAQATVVDDYEARRTGISADDYWASRASFWETYYDTERYPATTAVWSAGGFDDPAAGDGAAMVERLVRAVERLSVEQQPSAEGR
jgi:AcrR family transcriptional regulator